MFRKLIGAATVLALLPLPAAARDSWEIFQQVRPSLVQVVGVGANGRFHMGSGVSLPNGTVRPREVTRPAAGHFEKAGVEPGRHLVELRTDDASSYELGQELKADVFSVGDTVDVVGVSKGKGFAGHVKRHNFRRGPTTHGSDHHREPGSIGPGTTPGRVYKGVRMAGHMGDERATIKKVRVVRTDSERIVPQSSPP